MMPKLSPYNKKPKRQVLREINDALRTADENSSLLEEELCRQAIIPNSEIGKDPQDFDEDLELLCSLVTSINSRIANLVDAVGISD